MDMKRIAHFLPVLLLAFSASCSLAQKDDLYATVDGLIDESIPVWKTELLKRRIGSPSLFLLDAREKQEYAISHLKDAIWVGYDDFNLDRIPASISKTDTLVIYCSVGYRSEKVGEKLINAGYANVINVYGGIFDWVNKGYPVYNQQGKTEAIHGYDKNWSRYLEKGQIKLE